MARGDLSLVAEADAAAILASGHAQCLDVVRRAYIVHDRGDSSLPHSNFLRFPHRPDDRIIALPAYLGGEFEVSGIKWISSYPGNRDAGLRRASAVLVLNDTRTGLPVAFLEASGVSAARTAASAVLAAEVLQGGRRADRVGIIGAGRIAATVAEFLTGLGWDVGGWRVHDVDGDRAAAFAVRLPGVAQVCGVTEVFQDCDVVVLATTSGSPWLLDPDLLAAGPLVLHLSLRDLSPDVVLAAQNITDDTDHVLRERTSLQLTAEREGHTAFIAGDMGDLLHGRVQRPAGGAVVVSPFGLGVLDLAVGQWVHQRAADTGVATGLPGFIRPTELMEASA